MRLKPYFFLIALTLFFGLSAVECSAEVATGAKPSVPPVVAPALLSLIAGNIDGPGSADGRGDRSQFSKSASGDHGINTRGIASDAAGNLYVADSVNHTIRKVDAMGLVTTIAGMAGHPGSEDGPGTKARFNFPIGIVSDADGMLYVTDSYNNTVRKITPAGDVTTLAGTARQAGWADGTGPAARFRHPVGITRDTKGDLFVMDMYNACIRKISTTGSVTTLAGEPGKYGFKDGSGRTARFGFSQGIAAADNGVLYVADGPNHALRRISAGGAVTTVKLVGTPESNGRLTWTTSSQADSVSVDPSGNVYLINRVIHMVGKDGKVMVLAGNHSEHGAVDGKGSHATFISPGNVAFDQAGNLYVTDVALVRKITPQGDVTTIAGQAVKSGLVNAVGSEARFDHPEAIAGDGHGNVYVIDRGYMLLRKIDAAGVVTTFTGLQSKRQSNPGSTVAQVRMPSINAIAADASGNVYVADKGMNRILKINPAGPVHNLTNPAGEDVDIDGADLRSRVGDMTSMISDKNGNLYFLYVLHDKKRKTIRKIDTTGVATTIAELADKETDFAEVASRGMYFAFDSIAIDNEKNLFLDDGDSLRKIDAAGAVTTVGDHVYSYRSSNSGGSNNISYDPNSMVFDSQGNMYWAVHTMIQKMTPGGVISTIAGEAGRYEIRVGRHGLLDNPSGLVMLDTKTLGLISRNAILKLTLP